MDLNKYIDHTLLKPTATKEDIKKLCEEAIKNDFASVCVNSCYAYYVSSLLKGSDVKTCCVVGFPLGAMSTFSKASEAQDAVNRGASEIDMVINLGMAKAHDWEGVEEDIRKVVTASKPAIVKVIIETCLLTDEEKVKACEAAEKAGAAFVKTSTGFAGGGATVHDVKLMKETVGDNVKVKASGGIRTSEDAIKMIEAGASRIGTSCGCEIC